MSGNNSLYYRRPRLAIAICMLMVAIIPIACGWLFYVHANDAVQTEQENMVAHSLALLGQKLDSDMRDMNNAGLALSMKLRRIALPNYTQMKTEDRHMLFDARMQIRDTLSRASAFAEEIMLFRDGCGYVVEGSSVMDMEIFYDSLERRYGITEGEWNSVSKYKEKDALLEVDGHVFFSMRIPERSGDAYTDRRLVMLLPQRYYEHIIQEYGLAGAQYCIISMADGTPLYETESIQQHASVHVASSTYYYVEAGIPDSIIAGSPLALRTAYLLLLLCAVTVGAILISILSRRITMPIDEITSQLRERFQPKTEEDIRGLNVLREGINQMLQEREGRERKLEELFVQQKKHEIEEAMRGNGDIEITRPFAVACLIGQPRVEKAPDILQAPGFSIRLIALAGRNALFLEKTAGETDEEEVAAALEKILQSLDEAGIPDCFCAMSRIHRGSNEMEEAWREAVLAADCVRQCSGEAVIRFDEIRFTPEYFLRDRFHLEKMVQFSRHIAEEQYKQALSMLDELFPEEYTSNTYPSMTELHLASLKYQFLHDMDTFAEGSPDADALRRDLTRAILSCRSHQELRSVIEKELDGRNDNVQGPTEQLYRIREYIREHYADQQLSVTSVAEHFGMPIARLSKHFAETAGSGVLQFIHKVRIEKASELLLEDNDLSIAEIASRIGYSSAVTFQRAFKARYGMPPGEFRQIHKKS